MPLLIPPYSKWESMGSIHQRKKEEEKIFKSLKVFSGMFCLIVWVGVWLWIFEEAFYTINSSCLMFLR